MLDVTSPKITQLLFDDAGDAPEITLTWEGDGTAEQYRVYRQVDEGPPQLLEFGIAQDHVQHSDTHLVAGKSLTYQVTALVGDLESAVANAASYLAAPDGITVQWYNGNVQLTWDAVPGAEKYQIFRAVDGGQEAAAGDPVEDTSWEDTASSSEETYTYRICAIDETEDPADPGTVLSTTEGALSVTVFSLSSETTQNGVELSWYSPGWVDHYTVYRGETGGGLSAYKQHLVLDQASDGFTDYWFANGKEYDYRVEAVGEGGVKWSTQISADKTWPAAPTTLSMEVPSSDSTVIVNGEELTVTSPGTTVELWWNESLGASQYELQRATDLTAPEPWTTIATISEQNRPTESVPYTDGPLDGGTYYYRVISVDDARKSEPSRVGRATVVTDSVLESPANLKAWFVLDCTETGTEDGYTIDTPYFYNSEKPYEIYAILCWDRVPHATAYYIYDTDDVLIGTMYDQQFDGYVGHFVDDVGPYTDPDMDVPTYTVAATVTHDDDDSKSGTATAVELGVPITEDDAQVGILAPGDKYIVVDGSRAPLEVWGSCTHHRLIYGQGVYAGKLGIYRGSEGGALVASGEEFDLESTRVIIDNQGLEFTVGCQTLYVEADVAYSDVLIKLESEKGSSDSNNWGHSEPGVGPLEVDLYGFYLDGATATVNYGDEDGEGGVGDGIPDLYDGYDRDRLSGDPAHDLDDVGSRMGFGEVMLDVKGGVDMEYATIYLDYDSSDPLSWSPNVAGGSVSYPSLSGGLRLWGAGSWAEGEETYDRTIETPFAVSPENGAYIASGTYLLTDLDLAGDGTGAVEAEGVTLGTYTLTVTVDPDGAGPSAGCGASVEIVVTGETKTYVIVNRDDDDNDGIVDFADGYNLADGTSSRVDDLSDTCEGGDNFLVITVTLPEDFDTLYDSIAVDYAASQPAAADGYPGAGVSISGDGSLADPFCFTPEATESGDLRVWLKDEAIARDPVICIDGGDYVMPTDSMYWPTGYLGEYWPSDFGLDEWVTSKSFYVEAVTPGDHTITFSWYDDSASVWADFETITVHALEADIDVDSEGDDGVDPPDQNQKEDQIENSEASVAIEDPDGAGPAEPYDRSGKVIPLNHLDIDKDGIPDYADGLDLDLIADAANGSADGGFSEQAHEVFVPIVLSLPSPIDLGVARIQLEYSGSDPEGITVTASDTGGLTAYEPADGALRLWTRADQAINDDNRSTRPFFDAGDVTGRGFYVPPTSESTTGLYAYYGPDEISGLGFTSQDRTVTLYVEGVQMSASPGDQQITLRVDPDGPGPKGYIAVDAVRVTVGGGDLDADANEFAETAPYRDLYEDLHEDEEGTAGKIILVNDGDKDGDGIPDFADGYDLDAEVDTDDDANDQEWFVPVVFELPPWADTDYATFRFEYDESDPVDFSGQGTGGVQVVGDDNKSYVPADSVVSEQRGMLRVWRDWDPDDEGLDRDAGEPPAGDYLRPGTIYTGDDLVSGGLDGVRTVTLYVEAVRASEKLGDLTIEVYADPDGAGGLAELTEPIDTIRLTALAATNPDAYSGSVCLADGTVSFSAADLVSNGLDGAWGHTRTFTNRLGFALNNVNGEGVVNLPHLVLAGKSVMVVQGATALSFDWDDGTQKFQARFDTKAVLASEQGAFLLTEPDGSEWRFHDFHLELPELQRGAFQEYVSPGNKTTEATYSFDGRLLKVERSGGDVTEAWFYDYDEGAVGTDTELLIQSIAHKRDKDSDNDTLIVGEAEYFYNEEQELEEVASYIEPRHRDPQQPAEAINRIDTTCYVYDLPAENGMSRPKQVFGPDAYQRAVAASQDPASGGTPNKYADVTFGYTGADYRVTTQTISGAGDGSDADDDTHGSFTYAYADATADKKGVGFNAWGQNATVTHDNSTTVTTYTNFAGQAMLTATTADSNTWYTYSAYDKQGRVTLTANPSAIDPSQVGEAYVDLVGLTNGGYLGLFDTQGLITHYDYYAAGDDFGADVAAGFEEEVYGYLEAVSISNGDNGTSAPVLVPQQRLEYGRNASHPVVVLKKETVYREENGTGAVTTNYEYASWLGTLPRQITTILPTVKVDGNDTNPTTIAKYDDFGRLEWFSDADQSFSYRMYDDSTGTVTTEVIDYYGLALTTVTDPDKFGRPLSVVESDGCEVLYEYKDKASCSHVVIKAAPALGIYPAEFVKHDRQTGIIYSGTMHQQYETLYSLTRTELDRGGRTSKIEEFFELPPSTPFYSLPSAALGDDHLDTWYTYENGVATQIESQVNEDETPDKLVHKTQLDGLGRVIKEWMGTNTADKLIAEYEYDNGQVGDGNLTKVMDYLDESESRTTQMDYDWRGRNTSTTAPDGLVTSWAYDNLGLTDAVEQTMDSVTVAKAVLVHDDLGRLTEEQYINMEDTYDWRTTEYDYRASGLLTGVLGPDDYYTRTDYNGAGMVTTESVKADGREGVYVSTVKNNYDDKGRLTSTSRGVDPASGLTEVSWTYYDDSWSGQGEEQYRVTGTAELSATGDGWVKALTRFEFEYGESTQKRTDTTTHPDLSWTETEFDRLDRERLTRTYATDGTLSGQAQTVYDGTRIVESRVFNVSAGSAGDYQVTKYGEFDALGRATQVTEPSGSIRETAYNYQGEATQEKLKAGGVLVEQVDYKRDDAGRVTVMSTFLEGGSMDDRTTHTATWYDALGNVTHAADYGTDGWIASNYQADNPPDWGSAYSIVTETRYDGYGRPVKTIDNGGHEMLTVYNEKGQVEFVIENYIDAQFCGGNYDAPPQRDSDESRVTQFIYDPISGQVKQRIAVDPNADGNASDNQITTYTYGDGGSGVPRQDLLVSVAYPDDGIETYTYYPNGQKKTFTDRRGVEHTYQYDLMGRLAEDKIINLGDSSMDPDTIRCIRWYYDPHGRLAGVTSYADAGATTIANDVAYEYDGWGHVEDEYQDHSSLATASSPNIHYDYDQDDGQGGPTAMEDVRLNEVIYPGGRAVLYEYGLEGGVSDDLSRVTEIGADGVGSVGDYEYLGAGWLVGLSRPAGGSLALSFDDPDLSEGDYDGFDQFGRIAYQQWTVTGVPDPVVIDSTAHEYNASGTRKNRTVLRDPYNETYTYDELDRLITYTREGGATGGDMAHLVKVVADSPAASDTLGWSVDVDGNTAVIGIHGQDDLGESAGQVYVLRETGFGWQRVATLHHDASSPQYDHFGISVSISDGWIAVGAYGASADGQNKAGAVYMYQETLSGWTQKAEVTAPTPQAEARFGYSVALDDDVLVVGVPWEDRGGVADVGAAYVFERNGDAWEPDDGFDYCGAAAGERYGYRVDVSVEGLVSAPDTHVVVGSKYGQYYGEATGAAYGYSLSGYGFQWDSENLTSLVGGLLDVNDYFGMAVAVSDGVALVGAYGDDAPGNTTSGVGAVYAFEYSGPSWWLGETLRASDGAPFDYFGIAVDIEGGRAIVGAAYDDPLAHNSGSAYVFARQAEGLVEIAKIEGCDEDDATANYFGWSVAVDADVAIAGVHADDVQGEADAGSADLYVSVVAGTMDQAWTLDGLGNWTETEVNGVTQTRDHDKTNRITTIDGSGDFVAYDAAGNMTVVPQLPLPGYSPGYFLCTYDAWNRLTGVYTDSRSGGGTLGEYDSTDAPVALYEYDGLNRRTTKLVCDDADDTWDRTDYYYDREWRVVEERLSTDLADGNEHMPDLISDAPYAEYVWDPHYADAPAARFRDADGYADADGDGTPDGGGDGTREEVLFYVTDANHNVTAVVNGDGKVVERYVYDAYGRPHVVNGDVTVDPDGLGLQSLEEWTLDPDNRSDVLNEILFSGTRLDTETNFHQVRHRYYHNTLGRWLGPDPTGYPDGMNYYEYCRSGPIGATDPLGLYTGIRGDIIGYIMTGDVERDLAEAWEDTKALSNDLYRRAVATGGRIAHWIEVGGDAFNDPMCVNGGKWTQLNRQLSAVRDATINDVSTLAGDIWRDPRAEGTGNTFWYRVHRDPKKTLWDDGMVADFRDIEDSVHRIIVDPNEFGKFAGDAIVLRIATKAAAPFTSQLRSELRLLRSPTKTPVQLTDDLLQKSYEKAIRRRALGREGYRAYKRLRIKTKARSTPKSGLSLDQRIRLRGINEAVLEPWKAPGGSRLATGVPKSVFRSDTRGPKTIFSRGFEARGTSLDLAAHLLDNTNPPSAYVGTTQSFSFAAGFSDSRYVYAVRPVNGLNTNALVWRNSVMEEVSIPWRVDPSDIPGVTLIGPDGRPVISVLNPNYRQR